MRLFANSTPSGYARPPKFVCVICNAAERHVHVYATRHRFRSFDTPPVSWPCRCACEPPAFTIGPLPPHDRRVLYHIERRFERGERRHACMDLRFVARVVCKAAALYGTPDTRVYCSTSEPIVQMGTVTSC